MSPAVHAVLAIAVMAVVTFLTRALPFLLFDRGGNPPKLVLYLGRVLPPARVSSTFCPPASTVSGPLCRSPTSAKYPRASSGESSPASRSPRK